MNQRGNILFLILLAIVLFVALSYAVMGQREQVGTGMSREQADLRASQIINYATLLEQTVTRLRLSGGCRDTEINFSSTALSPADYSNTNSPLDNHCNVFDPAGGGMSVDKTLFKSTTNDTISSASMVQDLGTTCASAECRDVILHFWIGTDQVIDKPLCEQINKSLGIAPINGAPPEHIGVQYDRLANGQYGGSEFRVLGGNTSSATLRGKNSGCYWDNANGTHYAYYHVLLAR